MFKKFWTQTKRKWLPYIIAYGAKYSMRLLLKTCRIDVEGLDRFKDIAQQGPCILMLWHNRLVVVSEVLNTFVPQFIYTAFISNSRDGHPLALLAKSYKAGRVLRVSHNARHHALNQMIDHLKSRNEIILITPDGPRGPRYVVKPGIVVAAREAEANIVPFSWNAARCWKLNSWDKMMIPKPFTTIKITFGEPLTFPKEQDENLEEKTTLLQNSLLALGH